MKQSINLNEVNNKRKKSPTENPIKKRDVTKNLTNNMIVNNHRVSERISELAQPRKIKTVRPKIISHVSPKALTAQSKFFDALFFFFYKNKIGKK